jgi:hypothetical protein
LWLEPQYLVCRNIKCKNPECFTFLNIVYPLEQLLVSEKSVYGPEERLNAYTDKEKQEIQKFVTDAKDKWELVVSNGNSHLLHSKDINELNEQKEHLKEMYRNLIQDFLNSLEP